MRFHLGHPDYPQYGFYLPLFTPKVEAEVNRLGPVKFVAGSYDWPRWYSGFRGWTDTVNSLWWPQGMDNFATCVVLLDDARNDLLVKSVEAQRAAIAANPAHPWRWPSQILSARLSPPEAGKPGEEFPPAGLKPVTKETPLCEWLLYPLAPINLTSLDASERFRGLWLLPLVCIRYFYRNVPLNSLESGSSSASGTAVGYPLLHTSRDDDPNWMPPLRAYPQDKFPPSHYVAIPGNGTAAAINPTTLMGDAADTQARMENWRIVCRDVRSKYNTPPGGTPHDEFTGVVSDYPERFNVDEELIEGYHVDACKFNESPQARLAGGLCDVRSLDEFIARKIQFLFQVREDDYFYSVTIRSTVDFPVDVTEFAEDEDGPDSTERKIIPSVVLGAQVSSRTPDASEHATLVEAAIRWAHIYHLWRKKQAYFKFPGIFPLIPNGHAHAIRWDFSAVKYETTYIALEGVQGTNAPYCVERLPFYARIDGEGAIEDALQGFYAWTQLLDSGGVLTTHPSPKRGFIAGVNGEFVTINPARSDSGKVAVPVGLVVWMKPGVPYLDVTTNLIFDHYRFTTDDLLQIVVLKQPIEQNEFGHLGAIIQRYNPDLKRLVDSEEIWVLLLE